MKTLCTTSFGKFIVICVTAALTGSIQAETKHNRAIIRAVHGGAQVSNNNGQNWSPAHVGTFLGAHSVVKTASDGTVDLFLGDNGPVVRVTPDTSLGIDRLDLENTGIEKVIETQLDLKSGRILGSVKKMAAASKYEVKTPVGVAGIRGTEYDIDARGKVTIVTGTAVVVYVVNGTILPSVNVGSGQTVVPPTGGGQPTVTPFNGGGDVSLLQGVISKPDGTIVVNLEDGRPAGTTIDGVTTLLGGSSTGGTAAPGILAPSPNPIIQANPNHLPDETQNLVNQVLSPNQTGNETGGTSGFGSQVSIGNSNSSSGSTPIQTGGGISPVTTPPIIDVTIPRN